MANTSYYPPDVEVLQQIKEVSTPVGLATLQSAIVGPSFKKLKVFDDADSTRIRLGSYTRGSQFKSAFPTLPTGSIIDEDSLELVVVNYEGDNIISKSTVTVDSETGSITEIFSSEGNRYAVFTDANVNFNEIGTVPGPDTADNDGHFIRMKVFNEVYNDYEDEYFEIQEIRNDHTVVIDDPNRVLEPKSNIAYISGNFGWMLDPDTHEILMTKRLDHSGTVYISGRARRTDYTDKLIQATSVEELEDIFGAGEITPENPLAFGMAKVLPYLATGSVTGIMVDEGDEVTAYQKAFEELESKDVYCIVPLTNNPIVHQMLKEHVVAMSDVLEKRERIGIVNGGRILKQTKSGLMGRKKAGSDTYDFATGSIQNSGEGLDEDVICSVGTFACETENEGIVQSVSLNGSTRAMVYFKGTIDDNAEITYTRGDSETPIALTLNSDGYGFIEEGEVINTVRFNITAADTGKVGYVYGFKTVNTPAKNVIKYSHAMVADGSIAVNNSTITPIGKRCIKIRCFSAVTPRTGAEALAVETLPNGLKVKVNVGGEVTEITRAGMFTFDSDITSISFENSANATDIGQTAVELLIAENGGTYKMNIFKDEYATFASDNITAGEDKLVIINKTEADETTTSGFKETSYTVEKVVDEDELIIAGTFAEAENGEYYYRVETPVITSKRDLAEAYAAISEAYGERRLVNVYAPAVGALDADGNEIILPGYYACCAIAGMVQSYPPQIGLTNSAITGFTRVLYTNNYFSPSQLNRIAGAGTLILIQENTTSAVTVRHQLTTNSAGVKVAELSITKDLDYMAKMARINFRPYFGKYNITEDLYNMLNDQAQKIIARWLRDGNALTGTTFQGFKQDPERIDYVYACFDINIPVPLNGIRLVFAI